jgi:mycothiol system anti-sigma-R factor
MSDECQDFLERISYLLDNELEETECTEVRVHIESCSPCLERYDVQRTIKQMVARSCAERAPDSLRARVLVSLREVSVRYES